MLARILLVLVLLVVGGIALPPLCSSLTAEPPPPLPAAGRFVPIGEGVRVNLREEGEGPAVVLVHGLPGMASDWQALMPELAKRGRRALAYDRVGYGHSDPRADGAPHTPYRNAEELLALLDAEGLDRVTLVGWSYGGVTSMIAAQRAPERVERLVLIGTGGPDSAEAQPPEPPGFMRVLYSDPVLAWRRRVPAVGRGLIEALSMQAYSEKPMPDWWIPGLVANFARLETLLTYRGEMFTIVEGDFDPTRISMPTLLVHGDDDRLAPVAIATYLGSVIPSAETRIVPGGSHMLPVLEAELVADAITSFGR